jgi:predicted nucleotide-binding protein
MFIHNIFDNRLHYRNALNGIHNARFRRNMYSAIPQLVNLLTVMEEELQIFHIDSPIQTKRWGNCDERESTVESKKVFIVHGHDEAMKSSVARVLEQLGLEPIILHEQPNCGQTIIEKFSEYSDVGFAVVLLSPDDLAWSDQDEQKRELRARQNVIFEMGFFIGTLGRDRVMPLARQSKEKFELPSDYAGVVFTPYDAHDGWRIKLIKEMNAVGYKLDANVLVG